MLRALVVVVLAACGDNSHIAVPATLSAGPVTIDTRTMTITVEGQQRAPMSIEHFLGIATVSSVDDTHYYDPTAPGTLETPTHAVSVDGDWIMLDDGTRLRLTSVPLLDCAELDIDASQHAGAVLMQLALARDPTEPIFGTGDAPVSPNVAGSVREMQLRVDPTSESSLNETHVPVPLALWPRRGVGLFVADDRPGALDLGKTTPDRVTATFAAPSRGTYKVYIYRATNLAPPSQLVDIYQRLSARPAIPPRWAFAPMQWRNTWDSSSQVIGDADAMRTRHIPGSTMWIDNPWQTGYNTFEIDPARFAQPQQLVADLEARGFHVVFWSTPYVDQSGITAGDFSEARSKHFLVTDDGGSPLVYPWQNGPGALVDFSHAGAVPWWQDRIKRVTDVGARGFKLDFGEEIVPELGGTIVTMLLDAGDNTVMHNRYAGLYHQAYLGALPQGDGFLLTRAGAWGEQQFNTAIWPGDLDSDFSLHGVDNGKGKSNVGGLPSAISRGLSLSVSGYPFYGSDIGGFRDGPNQGAPTTEVLLRWAEYAALGTIMQLGGGGPSHDPWDTTLFTPGADAIYKQYAELHMLLDPYLWTLAQDGLVTQPAAFAYECDCDPMMFLLGHDILVAPVVTAGATTREVVLPPGTWVDKWTGARITGDGHTSITVSAPLAQIPMWYRAGSLIPMFARAADTLLPATAPGVTSYEDAAFGSELRFIVTPGLGEDLESGSDLHDGTHAFGGTGPITYRTGTQYKTITFDLDARSLPAPYSSPVAVSLDGVDLPSVASDTAMFACATGCWQLDAAAHHVQIRVPGGAMDRTVAIR
ncbi:MAG: uncharacterized protein JWO36_543 [Myxococcales bacterium]|nr:uncharacterized protein [Myxococcales bacterium]